MPEKFVEYVWTLSGKLLARIWKKLEKIWAMCIQCLYHVRHLKKIETMSGHILDSVWTITAFMLVYKLQSLSVSKEPLREAYILNLLSEEKVGKHNKFWILSLKYYVVYCPQLQPLYYTTTLYNVWLSILSVTKTKISLNAAIIKLPQVHCN